MKAVATTLGLARSNLTAQLTPAARRQRGRPPQPDGELVDQIKAVIGDMPTYGYRRVHAILRRAAREGGTACAQPQARLACHEDARPAPQATCRGRGAAPRRRIAVAERNRRWCSDGFEIGCDNGERVRVAFALDCCDREAMSFVATTGGTGGIGGDEVRDLMLAAVEHRFGQVNQLPEPIEWLTDNGSCYVARDTREFARDIGLEPRTTPLESPQSNGMAEAFVRTFKRDYARVNAVPNAQTVLSKLPSWFDHYNRIHPHKALSYRSPIEFISAYVAT